MMDEIAYSCYNLPGCSSRPNREFLNMGEMLRPSSGIGSTYSLGQCNNRQVGNSLLSNNYGNLRSLDVEMSEIIRPFIQLTQACLYYSR